MISRTPRGTFQVCSENGLITYGIYANQQDAEKRQKQINIAQGVVPKGKKRGRPLGSKNKTRENELNGRQE
jgi:hypothetical protein